MKSSKCPPKKPLTREYVHGKLTQAWARTIAQQFKGNKTEFARRVGCDVSTVRGGMGGEHLPELHTVLNSLIACPNALDELLSAYGYQLIALNAEMSPDMVTLGQMGHAIAEFIDALSDGKRTHQETLELAAALRPLVPRLTQIIHEADGLREVA